MDLLIPSDPRLVGTWRRSLLVHPDGSEDTASDVRWLQAASLYVDSRGFAGRLEADDHWTCWRRDVDLLRTGQADEGLLVERGDLVVETGRHEAYTEHWQREPGPTLPTAGLLLHDPATGGAAVLVRVGPHLGWADGDAVVLHRDGPDGWAVALSTSPDAAPLDSALTARAWEVVRSEGDLSSLPPLRTERPA